MRGASELSSKALPSQCVLRNDRHHANDQRQLPVANVLMKDDRMVIRRFNFCDLRIGILEIGQALVAQGFHRKHHIRRGHRLAIGEFRLGPDLEGKGLAVVADINGFRQQAIERKGLIPIAPHQAFKHIGANPHDGRALHNERVKGCQMCR